MCGLCCCCMVSVYLRWGLRNLRVALRLVMHSWPPLNFLIFPFTTSLVLGSGWAASFPTSLSTVVFRESGVSFPSPRGKLCLWQQWEDLQGLLLPHRAVSQRNTPRCDFKALPYLGLLYHFSFLLLFIYFQFSKTGFFCVAYAVLELTL